MADARHSLADFFEAELPKWKAQWEAGSFSDLQKAFLWCAGNGYPFPVWLREAVMDELAYSKAHRPRGGTKAGNSEAQERYARMHKTRHLLMDQVLKFQKMQMEMGLRTFPLNETEAAREVQAVLGGKHPFWGTTDAIKKSYKLLKSG